MRQPVAARDGARRNSVAVAAICAACVLCLVVTGCTGSPPPFLGNSPEPPAGIAAESPIVSASGTPAVPPASPTPQPTATLIPAPTLSRTASPAPSPTATRRPSATPSPAPTAVPSAQLLVALLHQANGDYELAIDAYQAVVDAGAAPDQQREARYRQAECLLLSGEYALAAMAWEEYLARYAGDGRYPQASFMAARAYRAANLCSRAIPHLQAYLRQETELSSLANEWIGDCRAAAAETGAAIASYRRALEGAADTSAQVSLREKIAGAHLALGEYEAALQEYEAILAVAKIDDYRAKIEYLSGQALAAAGQAGAAHERYRRAVDAYPKAGYAYLSLVELVNAGIEVDEFQRALVDYYAGTGYPDAYDAAIRALDRYVATGPAPRADEALYYKALSQRALERLDEALATLDTIIEDYPHSQWLARAWFEKAATLALAQDTNRAVKAYLDLAAFFPADPLAAEALWQAARLREGAGEYTAAAALYGQLQADFPGSEKAEEALWRAGLLLYRSGAEDEAAAEWEALVAKYAASTWRPRALFWLGKLEAALPPGRQEGYWDQLASAYPGTYYALRAGQLRSSQSLTAARLTPAAVEAPTWDARLAEQEILAWLSEWTEVPAGTGLLELPASWADRSDLRQGLALLAVAMRHEALAAFDGARAAAWRDPLALAWLAFFFQEQGVTSLASRCAHRLVGLWPGGTVLDAPLAVQRLVYPVAYADLLSAEAVARDLDPLLLAALIRQESLFEPTAESYAGARGLGQVMPATGEGIAKSLGLEGFVLDDLYRPAVSIRFGACYLEAQMTRFDGQVLVALAAYNGGPGNTLRWLEAGGDDLDLFVELITAGQSQRYLQQVYEQYIIYETLYRPPATGN